MGTSKVFFIDLRASTSFNLLQKIEHLVTQAGIDRIVAKRDLTAIKIHFGERGNTAFVRPILVRPIVNAVKNVGGKPFLTDASTLYVGSRSNAVEHLATAHGNGFVPEVVGAPVVIADGLRGRDEVPVRVDLKHFRETYIAAALVAADSLISVAHFKLHELAGFGGAIKNVGMGGASRKGKMRQHADMSPVIRAKKCVGCGTCVEMCAHEAISMVQRSEESEGASPRVARIDPERCVGCGTCIHACPQEAVSVNWGKDIPRFLEKMVEYTVGALMGKEHKSLFVNVLTQISPGCDCHPCADAPIVGDVGIMASTDPVAVDKASLDLVQAQPLLPFSCLAGKDEAVEDKVRAVYPKIPWERQFVYAEKVGLGSQDYELVKLEKRSSS